MTPPEHTFGPDGFPVQTCDGHHDTGQPCYGCWLEGGSFERERIAEWLRRTYPMGAAMAENIRAGVHDRDQ